MVGGLKHVLVKAGREREFEKLFADLREEMRKHEPGCVYYSLLKSRTKPRVYIVEEQYRDEAALEAHE
jgi:quinol monooxygenase YgiN